MIVLIDECAAGRSGTDISCLVNHLPEVRVESHPKRGRGNLYGERLPVPVRELFIVGQCVVDCVTTIYGTADSVNTCVVRIGNYGTLIELNQPRILLLHYSDCTVLLLDTRVVECSEWLSAGTDCIPQDSDRRRGSRVAPARFPVLAVARGEYVRGTVRGNVIEKGPGALIEVGNEQSNRRLARAGVGRYGALIVLNAARSAGCGGLGLEPCIVRMVGYG